MAMQSLIPIMIIRLQITPAIKGAYNILQKMACGYRNESWTIYKAMCAL